MFKIQQRGTGLFVQYKEVNGYVEYNIGAAGDAGYTTLIVKDEINAKFIVQKLEKEFETEFEIVPA